MAALLAAGALAVLIARALGRSGTRASLLVSVVAQWLGAHVLWSLAGGLAVQYGLLGTYDARAFGLVALAGGIVHYRAVIRAGPERGRVIFVAIQMIWLVAVLAHNSML